MKLVIVESPTKAKTISRFLSGDFKIESSYGHIRDLPKSKLGVDIEHSFQPQYVIPKKSQKTASQLKKLAKNTEQIILATDEDREGEAIAWHVAQILGLGHPMSSRTSDVQLQRITFHEITKEAIEEALKRSRDIDMNLVEAQQARRILDRLVGYKLSPFLWKKVMRGLSAGRVQSVTLRLIVEREKEIRDFNSETYWTIIAALLPIKTSDVLGTSDVETFEASLIKINDKPIPKPGLKNKKEAFKTLAHLKNADWQVISLEKKASQRQPLPPFTTSTLQQTGWQRLRFSAKKTMFLAQHLYETGLITYMRTDSLNLAQETLLNAKSFIKNEMGEKYALPQPRQFKTKSKLAQEAHEAIRPTDPSRTPANLKKSLKPEQFKVYDLIWRRFIASQMPPAIFENTNVLVKAKEYIFQAQGSILRFDGFLKIYPLPQEDKILPELKNNQKLELEKIRAEEHQTQPPPRYTEASLVKTLEKFGIGRPSTYAPIISVIQERGYVIKEEKKRFLPTEVGEKVNEILVENFPKIVDVKFTREMEEDLDEIARGKKEWVPVIREFYQPFEKNLKEKYDSVEKQSFTETTNEVCEKCGQAMVIKQSRFGRFLACSGFPKCRNTKKLPPTSLNIPCPKCKMGLSAGTLTEAGEIVERRSKKGRIFYGCSKYPACDFVSWQKPT